MSERAASAVSTETKAPSVEPKAASPAPRDEAPQAPRKSNKKLIGLVIAGVVAVVGGTGGFHMWQNAQRFVSTNNAYVRGDILTASAKISGRLATVYVDEGMPVKRGQLVAELDSTEIRLQLRQAEANLAAARAGLASSQVGVTLTRQQTSGQENQAAAGVQAAQRQLDSARVNAERARSDFNRLDALAKEGGVSRQQLDQAKAAMESAEAQMRSVEAQVRSAQAGLSVAQSGGTQVALKQQAVLASEAQIKQAEAAVAVARQQLANTQVLAPIDGMVAKKHLSGGEMVQPGQAIAQLVDGGGIWVEAMVEETHIAHVQPGESVKVEVDAYPGRAFEGRVMDVGSATGAEFALIPQNNAVGNFTKVVQRLPVRIAVDNPEGLLKPGMSAVVAIDVLAQPQQGAHSSQAKAGL